MSRAPFSGQDPNPSIFLKGRIALISLWMRMSICNKHVQHRLLNLTPAARNRLITQLKSSVLQKYQQNQPSGLWGPPHRECQGTSFFSMTPAHQNLDFNATGTKARCEEDKRTLQFCCQVQWLYTNYDTTACLLTPWNIEVFFFLGSSCTTVMNITGKW